MTALREQSDKDKLALAADVEALAARFDSLPAGFAKEEVRLHIILGRKRLDEWGSLNIAPIHEWMEKNKDKLPTGSI